MEEGRMGGRHVYCVAGQLLVICFHGTWSIQRGMTSTQGVSRLDSLS